MKTDLVVEAFLIYNNKVLLVYHKKLNFWLPPGGHIEKNETPDETVLREFKEEVGLDVEILNRNDVLMEGKIVKQLAVPFYVNVHNVGDHDHCCLFYLCTTKYPEKIKINKSELKDFGWFSAEELDQKLIPADVRNIAMKAFDLFKLIQSGKEKLK
jgi:8-oxo-dGTP pyrophosphatase MutT (NUDIX family)